MVIVNSVSPSSGSSGAISMAPMVANGDCHCRQWMSPLAPMAIVIAIGATHRIAIGDNGASIGASHCRHWRHSLSPMAPNAPLTKLNDTFTPIPNPGLGFGLGLGEKSAADLICHRQSPPIIFHLADNGGLRPPRIKSANFCRVADFVRRIAYFVRRGHFDLNFFLPFSGGPAAS